MVADIVPDFIPRPPGEWIDLQDVFFPKSVEFIKLQNLYLGPSGRLLSTQTHHPRVELIYTT